MWLQNFFADDSNQLEDAASLVKSYSSHKWKIKLLSNFQTFTQSIMSRWFLCWFLSDTLVQHENMKHHLQIYHTKSVFLIKYLEYISIHGLRMAFCLLTRTLGLSHKERDVTWVRICMGSLHNSASAIFLEEVPFLTHWHHLSLYTWWHLLAFFMCQSINIKTVEERKIPSSWLLTYLRHDKHQGHTASGEATSITCGSKT